MSLAPFDMLVGASADVKELEYCSALHQTDLREVRKDASIKAEDIRLFLSSRYGIVVSNEQVRDTIISGQGGGSDGDDVLDLMEIVAMLLVPTFLKAADVDALDDDEEEEMEEPQDPKKAKNSRLEGLVEAPRGLLDYVLKMILHDVTGSRVHKELTPELIKRILVAYGEHKLAQDDKLINEMFDAAIGKGDVTDPNAASRSRIHDDKYMLNVQTFAEALTHDVKLYDIRNEIRNSTNLDDIFVTDESIQRKEEEMLLATNAAELDKAYSEAQNVRDRFAVSTSLERRNTLPAIDVTAENYRSKGLIVTLWATILITYFAYFFGNGNQVEKACGDEYAYEFDSPWGSNNGSMSCEAVVSVFLWLYFFATMSAFGIVCVYIGSIGNEVDCREPWKPVVGFFFVLLLVTLSYGFLRDTEVNENAILYFASLVLGCVVCFFHLGRAISMNVDPGKMEDFLACFPLQLQLLFSDSISAETRIKQATARKLNDMALHALDVVKIKDQDTVLNTHYGQALKNYNSSNKNFVEAGGFFWTWRRFLGRNNIFSRDGIWVPARMVASNISQYIVAVYILFAGLALTTTVQTDYDKDWAKRNLNEFVNNSFGTVAEDQVVELLVGNVSSLVNVYLTDVGDEAAFGCGDSSLSSDEILSTYCSSGDTLTCDQSASVNYLCPLLDSSNNLNSSAQQALLSGSGFDEEALREITRGALQQAAEDSVDTLYPSEKYMIVAPMLVGTILSFILALSLALMYIPSVTCTILKLRSGNIPTLRDKDFKQYRKSAEQVAAITGSIFWGSLFGSLLVGGAVALIVFFFLWQATAYYAQRLVAIILGIVCATIVRFIIVMSCRTLQYKSFYRERPGAANLSLLALEWANLAVSAGFVLLRMVKILLAAASFIGRIDTPFLANKIGEIPRLNFGCFGIGPIPMDNFPNIHLKDILSHEAHRHPYIEQLGVMYLMKLRYEGYFGRRAGACWRLIFVYALMPWLEKYRLSARPEEQDDEKKNELEEKNPRLKFVSLRNIYATGTEDEGDGGGAGGGGLPNGAPSKRQLGDDNARMRELEEETEAQVYQISKLEEDCKGLEKDSRSKGQRISELEAELKRLQEELGAKAAQALADEQDRMFDQEGRELEA